MTVPIKDQVECWKCGNRAPDDAEVCPNCRIGYDRTPLKFGKYRVEAKLGSGGFGDVWLCNEPGPERPVAVKKIRATGNPAALQSATVEMRQGGQLDHANIVKMLAADTDTGIIVYEYLAGGSLEDKIHADAEWVRKHFLNLAIQVVSGLAQAHGGGSNRLVEPRKVIHRDLKPANILLTQDGVAKIGDFGVARTLELSELAQTPAGTPIYMAPEALDGEDYDVDVDLHSVGIIFYEMLTGRRPFTAQNRTGLVLQKRAKDYIPLRPGQDAIPEICRIVDHLLDTPDKRLKSSETLLRLLEDLSPLPNPRHSIDSMQVKLSTIYGLRVENQYPAAILMRLNASMHGLTGGLVHPNETYRSKRVEAYLPRLFSWICACSSIFGSRVSDLLALKFAGLCPYCGGKPCECDASKREPDNDRNEALLARLRANWRPVANPMSRTFNDYYEELAGIYGPRDGDVSEMCRHAFAEVAEAMDAWLRIDKSKRHDDLVILRLELADVVAWFFALLRAYKRLAPNYSFVEAFDKFFAHGCYACQLTPCGCPAADVGLNMSTWRSL